MVFYAETRRRHASAPDHPNGVRRSPPASSHASSVCGQRDPSDLSVADEGPNVRHPLRHAESAYHIGKLFSEEISLKGAKVYEQSDKRAYKMRSKPRGYALVINNRVFSRRREHSRGDSIEALAESPRGTEDLPYKRRTGSEKDVVSVCSLFRKLYFKVEFHFNLTKAEMRKVIKEFAAKDEHEKADACFVFIMSHGTSTTLAENEAPVVPEGGGGDEDACRKRKRSASSDAQVAACGEDAVVTADCLALRISWVEKQFNNVKAPNLVGKPKVLVFHCCRGKKEDEGVVGPHHHLDLPRMCNLAWADAVPTFPPKKSSLYSRLPTVTDMLVLYSTVPGHVANRDDEGTWYIQGLCRAIQENAHDTRLRDILDEAAQRLTEKENWDGKRQSSEYIVRTFKKFYFNPYLPNDDVGSTDTNGSQGWPWCLRQCFGGARSMSASENTVEMCSADGESS